MSTIVSPEKLQAIIIEQASDKIQHWQELIREGLEKNYNIATGKAKFEIPGEMPITIQGIVEQSYDEQGWYVDLNVHTHWMRTSTTYCSFMRKRRQCISTII